MSILFVKKFFRAKHLHPQVLADQHWRWQCLNRFDRLLASHIMSSGRLPQQKLFVVRPKVPTRDRILLRLIEQTRYQDLCAFQLHSRQHS
ncbi:hypothetical protein [Microcoleus sp. B4-D4]|uniref:hypothetical protein n=1 Tax=Microcoleus sp. B4-D4 TaxID=2818667 RepID=UPI002FCF7617